MVQVHLRRLRRKSKTMEREETMRIKHDEIEQYGGSGGGGDFSLKDDGDTARVRFMYNDINDVEGYAVHEVEIDGKKRYVNCLREYNSPIDDCPFCRERKRQVAKIFVPIYNVDTDRVQVWERGKKFISEISGLIARYSSADTPFCSQVFEIERQGKKGSTSTQYGKYPVDRPDGTTLDDLPELPNILGGLVLDKSAEDMEYFLEEGYFPPEESESVRRGNRRDTERRDSNEDRNVDRRATRRVPGRERDKF